MDETDNKGIIKPNVLNDSIDYVEDFIAIQSQDLNLSKKADNLLNDDFHDDKSNVLTESDKTSIVEEKKKWVESFSKIFKHISNKDRDYVYFMMYEMSKKLSLYDMADVLIDIIKFNNNKTILLGSAYAVSFFEDCDYNYFFNDKLASLFGALLNSNNEIVISETESLLERFLCDDLLKTIEKRNDLDKTKMESIKNIWRYCQ